MPIRVILADDHAVVRQGIRDFLEEDPDIQVIAEASDGTTVKKLISDLKPDIAVLDVRMPHATGIDVARWIQAQNLAVKVMILTAYDDDPFLFAAIQAGATGFVLKNAEAEEITAAVRDVYNGIRVIDSAMNYRIDMTIDQTGIEPLTGREREVLQLVAAGLTNRAIGLKLTISDRTVQGHLASIYTKLQVNSRTEAVTRGLQLAYIHLPE